MEFRSNIIYYAVESVLKAMSHVHIESKRTELIETENRQVVARGRGWGVGKMYESGQKVQTSIIR